MASGPVGRPECPIAIRAPTEQSFEVAFASWRGLCSHGTCRKHGRVHGSSVILAQLAASAAGLRSPDVAANASADLHHLLGPDPTLTPDRSVTTACPLAPCRSGIRRVTWPRR